MIAVGVLMTGVRASTEAAAGTHRHKLDGRLRQALDREGDWPSRRVIVRVDPKAVASVRKLLKGRGDRTIRFHGGISAFTVESRASARAGRQPGRRVDLRGRAGRGAPDFRACPSLPTSQIVRNSVSLPGSVDRRRGRRRDHRFRHGALRRFRRPLTPSTTSPRVAWRRAPYDGPATGRTSPG